MIFSVGHIMLTAAITSALALIIALWRLPRSAWPDILAVTVLSGVAVLLWRLSANMPALNDDGLPGFSASDWAAPVRTFVSEPVRRAAGHHRSRDHYRYPRPGRQRHHHLTQRRACARP